jgi:hypothetical protein
VRPEAQLLLGDEGRLVLRLGRALLAGEDLARAEDLDRLSVDVFIEARDPEDRLALCLGARARFGGLALELRPRSASVTWNAMSSSKTDLPLKVSPPLKVRASCRLCEGLGSQSAMTASAWMRLMSPGLGWKLARVTSQSSSAGVGMRYWPSETRTLCASTSCRRASLTSGSTESAPTAGCNVEAMFSAVRWMLLTYWSRQIAFATGCAKGCGTSVLIAAILPRISLGMLLAMRS